MNEFQLKVQIDLENCEQLLLHFAKNNDVDDYFFECCGRVWAYKNLGLITFECAITWVDRFAIAAKGKTDEV